MDVRRLWVYLDDENGRAPDLPARMAAEAMRFARVSGLTAAAIARSTGSAEKLAAAGQLGGLDVVYTLSDDRAVDSAAAGPVAARLRAACETFQPALLLLPASALGGEIGARVAAGLGKAFLSRCVDLEWQDERPLARRAVHRNRAHQVVRPRGGPPWVATVDVQVLEPASTVAGGVAAIEDLGIPGGGEPDAGARQTWRVPARELDVLDADIVLSVGRGVPDGETLEQVHELSELLGAAVGGSREAVFGGLVTRDQQVGASGKWIAPRIYVALAISGSTYHMMGIREAKHIVAVNLDAGAPIFERAELGVVDDVAKIVPALIAAARGRRDDAKHADQ